MRHVDGGQEFNGGDGVTLTGPGTGDEDIGNSERFGEEDVGGGREGDVVVPAGQDRLSKWSGPRPC
ncbi:hypothetical protein ABT040_16670 [Streptomyces sp. NPDC002688]|uniref:hypothetical protein n=1 Tax=Streptomyces sp. NPDC002688 TaxID=3154423 RepID=UPI00331CEDD2